MSVEGIPQRESALLFTAHYNSYNPGERAFFTLEEAQAIGALGVVSPSSGARLTGGPFTQAEFDTLLLVLSVTTDGGFMVAIQGSQRLARGNFTTVTNPAGVAALINASLTTWATASVNPTAPYRFTITSKVVGASSTIGYATTPPGIVDLSTELHLTAATDAAITAGAGTTETDETTETTNE